MKRAAKATEQQAQLAFAEAVCIYAESVQLKNKGKEDDSGSTLRKHASYL